MLRMGFVSNNYAARRGGSESCYEVETGEQAHNVESLWHSTNGYFNVTLCYNNFKCASSKDRSSIFPAPGFSNCFAATSSDVAVPF